MTTFSFFLPSLSLLLLLFPFLYLALRYLLLIMINGQRLVVIHKEEPALIRAGSTWPIVRSLALSRCVYYVCMRARLSNK